MNESLYDKFCDTMSNVSFYGKTLVISGTPVFAVYYYVYSVFGGARWSELLALVTFGHLLPPLALVHLMYVNQTVCSVAFLFAFWGLREECPGGNLNRLPTLWSMLWQKTVGIYLTQVSLYFAWPLMVAAGWGHTGWSFFAVCMRTFCSHRCPRPSD